MDIEGVRKTAKDITSFSAKALLAYELTQVGGTIQTLEAADISTSENTSQIVVDFHTLVPQDVNGYLDLVSNQELQPGKNEPGFILFNTYDQNDVSSQDRLSNDLLFQKQWIVDAGIPEDMFEQGVANMPVEEAHTNFNIPVNKLTKEYAGAKQGSLVIPFSPDGFTKQVAIFTDPDGSNSDTYEINFLNLTPKEGASAQERKAIPALFKKNAQGEYEIVSIFSVPAQTEPQSTIPTIIGTPAYHAEVATNALNLRDTQDPNIVLKQVGRDAQLIVVSDEVVNIPGKNFNLRLVYTQDGNFAFASQDLIKIDKPSNVVNTSETALVYSDVVNSSIAEAQSEGIRIKAADVIAEQILPDVAPRPIVFIQSDELNNQSSKIRAGMLRINNVSNFLPIREANAENPNFTLDGKETSLNSNQAIEVAVSQSLLRAAKYSNLLPQETTLEEFMRNYQNLDIPIVGKDGQLFSIKANASVVFRFRGLHTGPKEPGYSETNFEGSLRSRGQNGELQVDMYITDGSLERSDFRQQDSGLSDEYVFGNILNNAIISIPHGAGFLDFKEMFADIYYKKHSWTEDFTHFYDPNSQVYLNYGLTHGINSESDYFDQYQPLNFK